MATVRGLPSVQFSRYSDVTKSIEILKNLLIFDASGYR